MKKISIGSTPLYDIKIISQKNLAKKEERTILKIFIILSLSLNNMDTICFLHPPKKSVINLREYKKGFTLGFC